MEVKFYSDPGHEHCLAKFQATFGGPGVGGFSAKGGGCMNYNVVELMEQGWHADFAVSAVGVYVQGVGLVGLSIPMWGLSGKDIGSVLSTGQGNVGFVAVMGGRGRFVW